MQQSVYFRWLGVNSLEIRVADRVLLVDPYVTRVPLRNVYCGRLLPDSRVITETISECDYILLTHAHFDHLLDVPEVVRLTGAKVFGSHNTCQLLSICGVPGERIEQVKPGSLINLGPFEVAVRSAKHMCIPGFSPGSLPGGLRPPLKARQYRMDSYYSYMIRTAGFRMLTDPGEHAEDAEPAEVLFVYTNRSTAYFEELLSVVRPKVVIPVHWDNMFRPLDAARRPLFRWPFLQKRNINIANFPRMIERIMPGTCCLTPDIMFSYDFAKIVL